MRILIPLMTAVMALAGCGGQEPTTSSRPPTPAPAPSSSPSGAPATRPSELLFAVLKGASVENRTQASTVAIVGLDGGDRANATFQPRKAPYLGNVADILQIEAQVGSQGVYVIDGFGA